MKKRIICLLFVALLLPLLALPTHAAEQAVVDSGTCGENLTWVLTEDGTLTISGTGNMENYTSSVTAPWYSHQSKILSVIVENGVTSIGDDAFWGCSSLTSITIPNSVISIGDSVFRNCNSLTSIAIHGSVTSIGDAAFARSGLTSITIPNSVTSIGFFAFGSCSNLKNITVTGGNPCYNSLDGVLFDKKCVTLICCPGGKTGDYTIPMGVTSIGGSAFSGCSSLTGITIPNSVTSIGSGAFMYCSSLTNIAIPDSVTSIGSDAFSDCASLTSITLPNNVTSIGSGAFRYCDNLKNISVSAGNQHFSSVDGVVFDKECVTLICCPAGKTGDYTIPMGVTSIGSHAFEGCASLIGITIPNSVTSIGDCAFYDCTSLTGITIPNSVTSIGGSAFSGCSSLTSITIPYSVACIGDGAFYYCTSLTDITIPDGVTNIGRSSFWGCNSLTSITIPDSVTSIDSSAFRLCTSLIGITIPNSVTSIGYSAFNGCRSLTGITIPDSVTSIGDYAFYKCYGLTDIYVLNREIELDTSKIPAEATIYGYSGSTAQTYAGSHGNTFIALGSKPIIVPGLTDVSYTVGSGETAAVYCSGALSELVSVEMDGETVAPANYTLSEGSTIVEFRQEYLDTLPAGTHIVTLNYTAQDGTEKSVSSNLEVKASDFRCKVTGVTMNLGNSLSMVFYVPVENVSDGDYAQFTKVYADGRADVTVKVPLTGKQTKQYQGAQCYLVGIDGIAAKEMNDNVTCVVCNSSGVPISKSVTMSVKAYAEASYNADKPALNTLLADLLNYGAAAQTAFGYDTGNPANAGVRTDLMGCATPDSEIDLNAMGQFTKVEGIAPTNIALVLKNNTRLVLYYPETGVDLKMAAEISYTDHHGNPKSEQIKVSELGGKKAVIIESLSAADFDTVVTVKISNATGVVSSCKVNMAIYCKLDPNSVASIPLAKYCRAAYNFFHPAP